MEHKIYMLVRVSVRTGYKDPHDATKELQSKTELQVGSTKNVKVLKHEILQLKSRTH